MFGPLTQAFDLVEVGDDLYSVVYRGAPGLLVVMHDRRSYELDIAFAPSDLSDAGRPYGMGDFIRVADPSAAAEYRCFVAFTASGVRTGLERLGRDLRTFGEPALAGDKSFLDRLASARQLAVAEWARKMRVAGVTHQATDAFRRQDWPTVVALYESLDGELDPAGAKRLEIARKRLGGD